MSTPTPIKRTIKSRSQGHMILVIARWVLVLAGVSLVLWNPDPIQEMRFKILFLLLLAAGNFYLGTQVLQRRRMMDMVVYTASLADLLVISLIVISESGFASSTYIFYYPAILAISVAFPMAEAALFTGGAVGIYGLISLFSMPLTEGNLQILIIRLLMVVAVAVIGNMYQQMESKRRRTITSTQEVAEDIFFGQIAIIWARWFFIVAATILVLWTAETTGELTVGVLVVAALMSVNFFVHGRYLAEKPANRVLILLTTLADLFLITFVVMFWGDSGLDSHFFIFYYPLFFAFALVFPPRVTIAYTLLALGCYAAANLIATPEMLTSMADVKLFVMRMITLTAMSGLGTYYYRIQRARRRAVVKQRARREPVIPPQLHRAAAPAE